MLSGDALFGRLVQRRRHRTGKGVVFEAAAHDVGKKMIRRIGQESTQSRRPSVAAETNESQSSGPRIGNAVVTGAAAHAMAILVFLQLKISLS